MNQVGELMREAIEAMESGATDSGVCGGVRGGQRDFEKVSGNG